jgi:hypothetical protein
MTMGHWVAQCVFVACELRIPDLVAGGPRTADELGEACGADPGAMLRLLRAPASLEVLAQTGDGDLGGPTKRNGGHGMPLSPS